MTTPKRHHYVPRLILNGFIDGGGWLHWCKLGKGNLVVRRARPSELFIENHLYSTVSQDGIKDPAMEEELSVHESEAGQVVGAILEAARAARCPSLSRGQRHIWYRFFRLQWRRTPEGQRSVISDAHAEAMIRASLDQLRAARPDLQREIDMYGASPAVARTVRNARVEMLRQPSADALSVLERRGMAILRIVDPNKSFIVGSVPIVKLTPPQRSNLDDPVVEMWLPIASDVAVGVGRGDGGLSLHSTADHRLIRQLNTAIASQSSIIAARSPELVRSLANRR
jgi:hypothetical protein